MVLSVPPVLIWVGLVGVVTRVAAEDVSAGLGGVVLPVPVVVIERELLDVLADEDSVDEAAMAALDEMLALVVARVVAVVKVAVAVLGIVVVEGVDVVAAPRQMYCSSGEVKLGSGD